MDTIRIGSVKRDACGRFYPISLNNVEVSEIAEYDINDANIKWKVRGKGFKYLKDAKQYVKESFLGESYGQ